MITSANWFTMYLNQGKIPNRPSIVKFMRGFTIAHREILYKSISIVEIGVHQMLFTI
jgi:hypothetical protein